MAPVEVSTLEGSEAYESGAQLENWSNMMRAAASFVAVVVILVGSFAVILYAQSSSKPVNQSSHASLPGGNGVFLNASSLPTRSTTVTESSTATESSTVTESSTTSTQSTQTSRTRTVLQYSPSGRPQLILYYENTPFKGAMGSYCWPPSNSSQAKCVVITPSTIPRVAVYPRPNVTLYPTLISGLHGIYLTLYKENPLTQVFSGNVTGYHPWGIPLNFTSGDYLLQARASYGNAEVSNLYNLTTVSSQNAIVDRGIRIQIAGPAVHYVSFTAFGGTSSGPGWEDWTLRVTSNTTTDIDLSADSVIDGVWVQFVPSHLSSVGPAGTKVHMLLAGAVRPFNNNDISNVSMIIQARGQSGGEGAVLIPLEGGGGVTSIRSSSPVNMTLPGAEWGISQGNVLFRWFTLVYDPGGFATNSTLSGNFSLVGMVNGTKISGLPSWLTFTILTPSVSFPAHVPAYMGVLINATKDAPLGKFAVLVKGVIDGRASYFVITFSVGLLISYSPSRT